ncbi:MAG: ammonium transporter [Desulfobacterota bacterium]|nr:ammonium transporter [Thermodesulfobacteriota bacterium]
MKRFNFLILVSLIAAILWPDLVGAEEKAAPDLKVVADTLWVLIAAALVFFMNTGFATVESGLCRAKNTVNILSKNVIVFCVTSLAFWAVGFGLMFGDGHPLVGLKGFFLIGADNSPATGEAYRGVFSSLNWTGVPLLAKFFFQLVFAGTAATIVSGAVAERIKYFSFFVFSFLMGALIYPIQGHWIWGGGWLSQLGFKDFAGSTVVHSIGGWSALVGAALLGPRLGKFGPDGKVNPIPGHNLGMATLGMFILWLGWFGFNGGSTMAADPKPISLIILNTNMAAAAGGIAATFVSYLAIGKPDLSMLLNGVLAGLVGITAGADGATVFGSIVIGFVSGILVVFSVLFFDRIKVDDPVGAISVHMVNGVWGTLAVGLFHSEAGLLYGGGPKQLLIQIVGILSVAAFSVLANLLVWKIIKGVMGLRVSEEEEMEGLDIGEHGMEAYPDFSSRA